ncbi:UTP--glucose-1-phosphate uridylyltransferase [Candidatus Uhrbacteria bacterium]|nr:UTP--glucose-1-phosphate uridylyltransferase [Candidatus Uhrbacteria bacterium]
MRTSKRPSVIRKAIIPVAGLGTRFLPATKAQPKEMLPVVDQPIIQHIVEEAVAAGITEIIFVTAVGKRAIEDHFDRNFELEYRLEQAGKRRELAAVSEIGRLASFAFVRQPKPLGDGHAVACALPFVDDDEAVAVLFGDDIIDAKTPALGQLIACHRETGTSVVAVAEVPREDTYRYGVIRGTRTGSRTYRVAEFVEKPKPADAPSRHAVIGRYILTPSVARVLRTQQPGPDGEIRLANAFASAIVAGEPLHARVLQGTWYDCGNKMGFLRANIAFGLKHPEIGKDVRKFLKGIT